MRLRRIELLCLRAADGLASERDLAAIRSAGIDPEDWIGLPRLIRGALIDPKPAQIIEEICESLELKSLPIGEALRDPRPVELCQQIMDNLHAVEPEAVNTVDTSVPIAANQRKSGYIIDIPVDENENITNDESVDAAALDNMESQLDLGSLLSDPNPPSVVDDVMQMLGIESSKLELEVEDGEDVFVLNDPTEEPNISEEKVVDMEADMDLPIAEALRDDFVPDIVESVMNQIDEVGMPQRHLRLVSSEEAYREDEILEGDTDEPIGGVVVEIQDIKNPVEIDADSTFGRAALWTSSAVLAVAAAFILSVMLGSDPMQNTNEQVASFGLASVNTLDILSIESEGTVQIYQMDETAPTIIFIEDIEGGE